MTKKEITGMFQKACTVVKTITRTSHKNSNFERDKEYFSGKFQSDIKKIKF